MVTIGSLARMLEEQISDADQYKGSTYESGRQRAEISARNAQAIAQAMTAMAMLENMEYRGPGNA